MPLCDPFIQHIFKDLFNEMVAEGVTSDPHDFRTGCYNFVIIFNVLSRYVFTARLAEKSV